MVMDVNVRLTPRASLWAEGRVPEKSQGFFGTHRGQAAPVNQIDPFSVSA